MAKLIGTGTNQVPTNGMLGGMAFQTPEDVTTEKISSDLIKENNFDVVTQTDIGTAPNQIPLNQFLGGLAYMDSVAGLDFSATSSASTGTVTSQILDDYEEGTWTPSYTGGISSVTYGTGRNGYYVKVGRMVTVWCNMMTNAVTISGSTQNVYISGLPFSSTSDTESASAISIGESARWASNPPSGGQIPSNNTNIFIYSTTYTTLIDPIFIKAGDMNTGSGNKNIVRIVATYMVNN